MRGAKQTEPNKGEYRLIKLDTESLLVKVKGATNEQPVGVRPGKPFE